MEQDAELQALASQVLALTPERRQALLTGIFSEMLPEVPSADADRADKDDPDAVRYRVQGVEVDQKLFELVRDNMGIFSIEQLGDADALLNAAEDAKMDHARAMATAWNVRWYLESLERNSQWVGVVRHVASFIGAHGAEPWMLPNAEQIVAAIRAGGWQKPAPDEPPP